MARPKDPTRARRGTGHRALPGQEKAETHAADVRLVDHELIPPPPPEDLLHVQARECWEVAVEELWRRGLRRADLLELRLMCEQYAVAWEAANGRAGWARIGVIIPDPRGDRRDEDGQVRHTAFMPNPTVKMARDAAATFQRMAGSFGLDIQSRMRLGLMQLSGQSLADALMEEIERD